MYEVYKGQKSRFSRVGYVKDKRVADNIKIKYFQHELLLVS